MSSKKHWIAGAAVLAIGAFSARGASAQVETFEAMEPGGSPMAPKQGNRFVFSANGPGAGFGAIGLGGRVFFIVPTFDLNYVRGFTDNFDLNINISTLGIVTFADLGVKLKLVGSLDSGFAVGLKAAATPILFFIAAGDSTAGAASFGLTPGLIFSFGGRSVQFSLGADVPMLLAGAGFTTVGSNSAGGGGTGFQPFIRPAATIEFPVGQSTNMYVQAQGYVSLKSNISGFFGPILAVGAAW